jgi:hypothetical protein
MGARRERRQIPVVDGVEPRNAPSGGSVSLPGSPATAFKATLTPTKSVTSPDPAFGSVTLRLNSNHLVLNAQGSLNRIVNVNLVELITSNSLGSQKGNKPVAVLISPGSGSGTLFHASFRTAVKSHNLIGPLAFRPLSALVKMMRAGQIDVVVFTDSYGSANNGLGEIRGPVQTPPHHP